MYHKDLFREPLAVCCDRTVRAGGASSHAGMTEP